MGPAEEVKLLRKFDLDENKRLDANERQAARKFLAEEKAAGRGPRRRGPRGLGPDPGEGPVTELMPGPKLAPAQVKSYPDAPLYEPTVLRTLFLEFEDKDWEQELSDFYHSDVEVPAKLVVDGKTYRDVGVHFRGASSFFTVQEGRKRSLNLSLDFVHEEQQLGGYRTLNLLNSHADPSFLRTMLYFEVARDYLPAPKANYVRLVINGESWGVYVNVQQFNKDFVRDNYQTTQGARWKVPGSPRARSGLEYLGENPADYKRHYQIKSKDTPDSWNALIKLTEILCTTEPARLERALEPLLDIDGVLRFLALENVFINNDGYWIRMSDYGLYRDTAGRFHLVPQDSNETFRAPERPGGPGGPGGAGGPGAGGPGGRGGPRVNGVELDPLFGADDSAKPLLSKLLAVPSLRARYLGYVRHMAEQWLDWAKLEKLARRYQALIESDVKSDVHKLSPFDAFSRAISEEKQEQERGPRGGRRAMSLKAFVEERRAFLLNHPEVQKAPLPEKAVKREK